MEKQRKLDEKIAKNKEKTLQKLERKAILEEERRKKPGECQKVILLDSIGRKKLS